MPEIDDDKGVSVVMVNSEKAGTLVEKISIEKFFVKYDDVLPYNRAIELSTKYTIKRDSFFLNQNVSFDKLVHRLSKVSVFQRVRIFMIRIISRWLCFFM